MTPQELKMSILQLAFQGKLTTQLLEDGIADAVIEENQQLRANLIDRLHLKKSKSPPPICEDELPFDIPEEWKWVRIQDYCVDVFSGKSPVYSKQETTFRIIGQAANQQSGLDLSQIKYTNEEFWTQMPTRYFLEKNDVLLNTLGNGTLGRSGIVTNLPYPVLTDGHLFVFRLNGEVQSKYFYYFFQFRKAEIEKTSNGSTNQTFLSLNKTLLWLVPVPPIKEQERIVAKIEELLPYIDRYEQAWSKLEEFNKRFPVDMQKSILQTAIQGKLVEQRPEEGTGEELYQQIQAKKRLLIKQGNVYREKKLSDIDETELPFEIPESWKWCKLGELTKLITKGSSPKWQGISYTDKEHGVLFVTSENVGNEKIILSKEKYVEKGFNDMHPSSVLQNGDLLTNIVGASIGRSALFDLDIDNANTNQAVCIIRLVNQDIARYILKYLNSSTAIEMMTKKSVDSARANLSLTSVTNLLIPLPPLSEQKRIVAKLEELLPLCDRLK